MKLDKVLQPSCILPNLPAVDKWQVIELLMDTLDKAGLLADRDLAMKDVLAREKRMSTGMEHGLAIPHAKTRGVDKTAIAFGRSVEGIDFAAIDKKPSTGIFLLLSPSATACPHVQYLSAMASIYADPARRKAMLEADSTEAICALLVK